MQKIISHRGNINGADPRHENMPEYISEALGMFDCEVDFWKVGEELFLGHDTPQYKIDRDFLTNPKLWVHCKNIEAMRYASDYRLLINSFWHQQDDFTLTTSGYLWTYPGKPLTNKSIAVLPETVKDWDISVAYGVCTDYPLKYERE